MATIKQKIKDATKPVAVNVNTTYSNQNYVPANNQVAKSGNAALNKATSGAEQAYQMAQKNNTANATKAQSTNSMVTKQTGNRMRRQNFSLTNRNIAGAAAARSAATVNRALSNSNANAKLTRDTSASKAKQSIYKTNAELQASNRRNDIARSTQLNKTAAEQSFRSAEAKKSRKLSNAITKREDKLEKKKEKFTKKQRTVDIFRQTASKYYQTTKQVDKAIAQLKKSKSAAAKQKIAYLRALRAQLKAAGSGRSGGGGGGRRYGRGGYGYRRYGSNGGGGMEDFGDGGNNIPAKKTAKTAANEISKAGAAAGIYAAAQALKASNKKRQQSKKAVNNAKGRGEKYGKGNYKRQSKTPSYISAILKRVKK